MEPKIYIVTDRLILRGWKEADKEPFAKINGNATVMTHFPKCLTPEESDELAHRINAEFKEQGVGLFAIELKDTREFIGFVGFHKFSFDVPFAPGWEVGWRLSDKHWGKGYATEAASACLSWAKEHKLCQRLYAFTAVTNTPSANVMRRIGMTEIGHFQHPALPDGHRLKEHLLFATDL